MKRLIIVGIAACLVAVPQAWGQQATPTNSYLIDLTGDAPADLFDLVAAAGGTLVRELPEIGYAIATSDAPGFAAALAGAQGIKAVDQDLMVQWTPDLAELLGEISAPQDQGPITDPTTATFYPCQWNMRAIDAPAAWAQGEFGDPNVKVAVLDGGVDPFHQDLVGKVDFAQSTSVLTPGSSPCNAILGLPDEETFFDFRFHGTFVASNIASNGIGMASVAPATEIVGVKVLNCTGAGSFGDVISGILYAANVPDAHVLNMSLGAGFAKNLSGAGPLMAALNKAVNYAVSQGKVVVSAAGNSGVNMDKDGNVVWTPAQSGSGISAYATNVNDGLASYSNYGITGTWVGAPGGDGVDPTPPLPGCTLSPGSQGGVIGACSTTSIFFPVCAAGTFYLVNGTGTSFAAPLVSGVAALIDGQAGGALNNGQVKARLAQSADDLGKVGVDVIYSHGRVNAGRAVE